VSALTLELRAADCRRCDLCATRQRVVFASGALTAPLALVGEAPGATEDAGGEPFIGRSGRLLFALLADTTGLSRDDCYVTNVVKCRPPSNRTPRRKEIDSCAAWLDEQLAAMDAQVLVALGNVAVRRLLDVRAPLGQVRGSSYRAHGLTIVPTFHPAAALRGGPSVTAMLRSDLSLAGSLLATAR
jgi:DNA polymerase